MARAKKSKKAAPSKKKPTKATPTKAVAKSKPKKSTRAPSGKSRGATASKKPRMKAAPRARGNRSGSAKQLTPAQKAAATRKAKAAKAAERKLRRTERQRERRREQREAEQTARRETSRERDERDQLVELLEAATPVGFSLEIVEAEVAARTPWTVVGKFYPTDEVTYAELGDVFRSWANDLLLEADINPQRIASIRVVYNDPKDRRGSSDSVVSHTGPWELVVSEMAAEMDPENPDSLAARYAETLVPYFYVYLSSSLARSSSWIPHYQRF